jgi:hypothetical protein
MRMTNPAPNRIDPAPWAILAVFAIVMALVTVLYTFGTVLNPLSRTLGL